MSPAGRIGSQPVDDISSWKTSCAIFVRAVHHWCGRSAQLAVNASGIFPYLQASERHPAWVRFDGSNQPEQATSSTLRRTRRTGTSGSSSKNSNRIAGRRLRGVGKTVRVVPMTGLSAV